MKSLWRIDLYRKPRPEQPSPASDLATAALDAALDQLGRVEPRSQLEQHVLDRLQAAMLEESAHASKHEETHRPRWPRLTAVLVGSLACALMVTGSLIRSQKTPQALPPTFPLAHAENGVGTAEASHITAHPVLAPAGKARAEESGNQTQAKESQPKIAAQAHPAKIADRHTSSAIAGQK